jgi:hypothetical protein
MTASQAPRVKVKKRAASKKGIDRNKTRFIHPFEIKARMVIIGIDNTNSVANR